MQATEEAVVVVRRLSEYELEEEEDSEDDEPLAFNSSRAATAEIIDDILPTIEPSPPPLSSSPPASRNSSALLDVAYQTNSTGVLVDITLPEPGAIGSIFAPHCSTPSQTSAENSPERQQRFRGRQNNLMRLSDKMTLGPSGSRADVKPHLPQPLLARSVLNDETRGLSNSRPARLSEEFSRWESESLDGFIISDDDEVVILEDSEDDGGPARTKQNDQYPVLVLEDTPEADDPIEDPSGNFKRLDRFSQARSKLGKIESKAALTSLYPVSLQDRALSEADSSLSNETEVLDEYFPARSWYSRDIEQLELKDFSVYQAPQITGKGFGGQLSSLLTLIGTSPGIRAKKIDCMLDGTFEINGSSSVVEAMQVVAVSVENLDDPGSATTREHIHIATLKGDQRGLKYRLVNPTSLYEDLFESFIWVADLAKHVFRFLAAASESQSRVHLASFESDFWSSIRSAHSDSSTRIIDHWHGLCGFATDFRRHVIRYGDFLYGQALSITQDGLYINLLDHPLWDDIDQPKTKVAKVENERTVVTPDVAQAFLSSFPMWGKEKLDLLNITDLSPGVSQARQKRCDTLRFPQKGGNSHNRQGYRTVEDITHSVVDLSLEETVRNASPLTSPNFSPQSVQDTFVVIKHRGKYRFAYVKEAHGNKQVKVVWLLRPRETICGSADQGTFYSVGNELFFSDECCCDPIRCDGILGSFVGCIFEDGQNRDNLFAHSLYRTETKTFHTADISELWDRCMTCDSICSDRSNKSSGYRPEPSKLETISLFSGAGLLDHALASTSYFDTSLAIEINNKALLSHKANETNKNCQHYRGSTNTFLKDVMRGRRPYGRYHLLVAGCPCQGFTKLNNSRGNPDAQRNCSMLANTLSYVDLLRPEYVLIENVPDMELYGKGKANACAQAICCLVSMGYQVRKMILSGSDFNATTKRKRLFIIAAAPGLELPEEPTPLQVKSPRTAWCAIETLPEVHNETTINIARPDHIPVLRLPNDFDANVSLREVMKKVPTTGPKRNLYGAFDGGYLTKREERWHSSLTDEKQSHKSASLQRVDPEGLFTTITRSLVPLNSRGGDSLHPFQARVLTCEELRRAQGLPNDFLLIGSVSDAVSQIGNGVVWEVGQALGRVIGEAWTASQPDQTMMIDNEEPPAEGEILGLKSEEQQNGRGPPKLTAHVEISLISPTVPKPTQKKRNRLVWDLTNSEGDGSDDDIEFLMERPVQRLAEVESPFKKLKV